MRDDLRKKEMTMPENKTKLRRVTAGLGLTGFILALIVFYALSLPALTLESTCGQEEHTHGEDCYRYVLAADGAGAPEAATGGAVSLGGYAPENIYTSEEAIAVAVPEGYHFERVLVCALLEHTHGEDCYADEAEEPEEEEAAQMMQAMFGPLSLRYSCALADFLADFTVWKDGEEVDLETEPVLAGMNYTIKLQFKEDPSDRQFDPMAAALTYQLPEWIAISELQSGDVTDTAHGAGDVGDYTIGTDGSVVVSFDPMSYVENYSNITFTLTLGAQFDGGSAGEDTEVELGDGTSIDIIISTDPAIEVVKEAGTYDPASRTIPYKVRVTAHNTDLHDITLTDVMGIHPEKSAQDPGACKPLEIEGIVSVTWPSGAATVIPVYSDTYDGQQDYGSVYEIPLTGVNLASGETATVTYSVRIADGILFPAGATGSISNLVNEVTAEGLPNGDLTPIEASDGAAASANLSFLSKVGIFTKDEGDPGKGDAGDEIRWTIHAGDGSDLRGQTIVDAIDQTKGRHHILADGSYKVEIELFDAYWKNEYLTDGTKFDDAVHSVATYRYPDNNNILNPFDAGTGFTLTVPNESREVKTVRITYTTLVDETSVLGFGNSATWNGRTAEDVKGILTSLGLSKTGAFTADNEFIAYTIEAEIPKDYCGKPVRIDDTMSVGGAKDDANAMFVGNWPQDMHIQIRTSAGSYVLSPGDYEILPYELTYYPSEARWFVRFKFDGFAPGAWGVDADSTVTLTYRVPLSTNLVDNTAYDDLGDAMRHGHVTVNNVEVHTEDPVKFIGANHFLSWPIVKAGKKVYRDGGEWIDADHADYTEENFYFNAADNGYMYSVKLNPLAGQNGKLSIAPNGTPPIFSDTFDARLVLDKSTVRIRKGGSTYTVSDPTKIIVTENNGLKTFSFDFADTGAPAGTWDDSDSMFFVEYVLLFDDANNAEGALRADADGEEFENTASIAIRNAGGDKTYSSVATVDYLKPDAAKQMTYTDGMRVDVSITINPGAEDLLGDGPGGDFELHDKMSANLEFPDPLSSIRIKIGSAAETYLTGATYDAGENEIVFSVPDNQKIVILYKAKLKATVGDTATIKNEVWLYGREDKGATEDLVFKVTNSNAEAEGHSYGFRLRKADVDDSDRLLPGAAFNLYAGYPYAGYDPGNVPAGVPAVIQHDVSGTATEFYWLMPGTTGSDGLFAFENQAILEGKPFLLVETQAPAGYLLPEPKDAKRLIWAKDGTHAPPSGATAIDILDLESGDAYGESHTVSVTNEAGLRLPETGGAGPKGYLLGGAAVMGLAAALTALFAAGRRRRFYGDGA
ncbi:MAG: hypothetical protein LBP73_07380 [Clostridiales Family XIII bacterium]|jgi:fimbrial isopeptide formation D2 family protein|nr:hypothetical protein [Clostridiales Family XIII bacterium]